MQMIRCLLIKTLIDKQAVKADPELVVVGIVRVVSIHHRIAM